MANRKQDVIDGFGDEWSRFPQDKVDEQELSNIFHSYFEIFPWSCLPGNSVGVDVGCGSGRWAGLVAPQVGRLYAVDASPAALRVAQRHCEGVENIHFVEASVDELPFDEESLDFAYSLGVLHHVPSTKDAVRSIAGKLKRGAPFLIYLYYSFDNRPPHFRLIWKLSEVFRAVVSRSPFWLRYALSQILAFVLYLPLAKFAWLLASFGLDVENLPLSFYRDKSFYTMRTDALDRFGTRLEQRFSRQEIKDMLEDSGFEDVVFSLKPPYWCAVARRA